MTCSLEQQLLPFKATPGVCDACGKTLVGRQQRWCSFECSRVEAPQHDWNAARKAAKHRDGYRCVKCGAPDDVDNQFRSTLQVNHIDPRVGKGYGWGCWNHLDNLETLCHPCHVEVTNAQAAARRTATLAANPSETPAEETLFSGAERIGAERIGAERIGAES